MKSPAHFQLVMGVDGGIPGTIDNLLHLVRQLPEECTFTIAGIGRRQHSLTSMSTVLGGHVRVGLEDNIYYEKGRLEPNEDSSLGHAGLQKPQDEKWQHLLRLERSWGSSRRGMNRVEETDVLLCSGKKGEGEAFSPRHQQSPFVHFPSEQYRSFGVSLPVSPTTASPLRP